MGQPVYEQLQADLKVEGFGEVCGMPVVLDSKLAETVEIVGLMGVPEEDESKRD